MGSYYRHTVDRLVMDGQKMSLNIKYPEIATYLGRAVELDGSQWQWTWNKRDNFALVADMEPDTGLFIFGIHNAKTEPIDPTNKRAAAMYRRFNRRYPDQCFHTTAPEAKMMVGVANHIVYESDKFGPMRQYIHKFETPPSIYVDNPNKPRFLAILGGNIRITKRGIEG